MSGGCTASYIVHLALLISYSFRVLSSPICQLCHDANGCVLDSIPCEHGTYKDICGNIICSKGLGERCGGYSQRFGQCGKGMQCMCDKCMGCSANTLVCLPASPLCLW